MAKVVRVQPYEVRQRLEGLGLDLGRLLIAVQAVSDAHSNCTNNDPPAARCWDGWRMGTRRLRELYRPLGWEKDDTDTYSVLVNHSTKVQVVIVNSTKGTGLLVGSPLNVAKKGPKSVKSATDNRQHVLDIAGFPEELARKLRMMEAKNYQTWCLCVYVSEDCLTVRAELLQPVKYNRGYISDWEERIILRGNDPVPETVIVAPSGDDDGLSPDFPIVVQRK